jgi:hypothetical protein
VFDNQHTDPIFVETLHRQKRELIRFAEHHKKTCEGATCNMSLRSLLEVGEKAGIGFTQQERLAYFT